MKDWRALRKQSLSQHSPVSLAQASTTEEETMPTEPTLNEELESQETELQGEAAPADASLEAVDAAPAPVAPATAAQRMKEISARELASLKRAERLQGRQAALSVLEKKALSLGYASVDEMLAAAPKKTIATTEAPPATQQEQAPRASARMKELEEIASRTERKLRAKQQEVANLRTEMELAKTARRIGINDEDYAVHLLRQKVGAMTADQAARFDPSKFFEGLRNTHGYLFTAGTKTVAPANTSPATKAPPAAPAAAEVSKVAASDASTDVTKLSPREYEEYLAKKGMKNPRYLS